MANLTEAHIRKIIREVLSESLILEISVDEKNRIIAKSNERVPFDTELIKSLVCWELATPLALLKAIMKF
jgi:hypothetical protein